MNKIKVQYFAARFLAFPAKTRAYSIPDMSRARNDLLLRWRGIVKAQGDKRTPRPIKCVLATGGEKKCGEESKCSQLDHFAHLVGINYHSVGELSSGKCGREL